MIRWVEGGTSMSLQVFNRDTATARQLADSIQSGAPDSDTPWTLPGAQLVLAASPGSQTNDPLGPVVEQVLLSPLDRNGVADLSASVDYSLRPGSEANLFRQLHELSGMGTTTEITIAGDPGFLVTNDFVSAAIVAHDDTISTWQTSSPDVELRTVVETVAPVSAAEWQAARDGVADVIERTANAVLSDETAASAGTIVTAPDPVLPRYLPPEPWEIDLVTDMALWTPEQRRQREALWTAHQPEGPYSERVRTQGFRRQSAALTPGTPPIAEIVVEVSKINRPTGEELTDEGLGELVQLGELEGYLATNKGPHQWIAFHALVDSHLVEVRSPTLERSEFIDFVGSLSPRERSVVKGFVTDDPSTFRQVADLAGSDGANSSEYRRWFAAAQRPGEPESRLVVSVEALDYEQFLMAMTPYFEAMDFPEALPGTPYLVRSQETEHVTDPTDRNAPALTALQTELWRYDAEAELLLQVDTYGSVDDAVRYMESLVETDIETWAELVGPFNADPIKPR